MKLIYFRTLLISIVLLLSFLLCLISCKTRQVDKSKTEVLKEYKQEASGMLSETTKDISEEKSSTKKQAVSESKSVSSSTAKIIVDSVVTEEDKTTGKKKTKAYGVRFEGTSDKSGNKSEKTSEQSDSSKKNISSHQIDSVGKSHESAKLDSVTVDKNTSAKGSGTTWPWVSGLVLIIVAVVWILLNRPKPKSPF